MTSLDRSATAASHAVNASERIALVEQGAGQSVAERGAIAAQARRRHQPLDEAHRLVALVQRQPGHDRGARQRLAPPLAQQRGLAETGGRLHRDYRLVFVTGRVQAQALARQQALAQARRGGLQHQLGRGVVLSHGLNCPAPGPRLTSGVRGCELIARKRSVRTGVFRALAQQHPHACRLDTTGKRRVVVASTRCSASPAS